MRVLGKSLRLFATDLANHLGCRHLTNLDRRKAEGTLEPPVWRDPVLDLLAERGAAHENAYEQHLRSQGFSVENLQNAEAESAVQATLDAMHRGPDVIVQATLQHADLGGRADFLTRVPRPSDLGNYSYEVIDTKLAQNTRAGTILQLCLYSDLVARIQGIHPERMYVVKPRDEKGEFQRDEYRFADFQAYYRLVVERLRDSVAQDPPPPTYPDPCPQCDICRWWTRCNEQRHAEDHLSLIAGAHTLHTRELKRQGIETLTQFAEADKPLQTKPERGSEETFAKIHHQARIQLRGRRENRPVHELLEPEAERGLCRLPAPSPGDIFFDFEGDPFVEHGGLEYLFGFAYRQANKNSNSPTLHYQSIWALDRATEKLAFEQFIDFVMDQWQRHPDLHIYHFHSYEPSAIKRLMGRHATREDEVDRLLRGKRFVDLHTVTRQGVRCSVEKYSLKDLEPFCGFRRDVDLRDASRALRRVEAGVELGTSDDIVQEDLDTVEGYNKEDCLATAALRDWLEELRQQLLDQGHVFLRPDDQTGDAGDQVQARRAEVLAVYDQLVAGLPDGSPGEHDTHADAWDPEHRARWLLAQLLDYFRREDKCAWWEIFRLQDLDDDGLQEERKAIASLTFDGEVDGGTKRCPVHRYRFPEQEAAVDEDDEMHRPGDGLKVGTVLAIGLAARTVDIKRTQKTKDAHPTAVFVRERVDPKTLDRSLLELARSVAANGVDGNGPFRAARDLLLNLPPRLAGGGGSGGGSDGGSGGGTVGAAGDIHTGNPPPLRQPHENLLAAGIRLAQSLDHGLLPVQGPPGTGKSHSGARMILALAKAGKRIGITAVSHKVIRNLLDKVYEAIEEEALEKAGGSAVGNSVELAHKVKKVDPRAPGHVEQLTDNDEAMAAIYAGKVVGGTAWLWARDDAVESLDYLFVDEAGQMSLAYVLAVGRSARNLVLLGDPQQLEQPQRGAHPDGTEVAALVHVLDGKPTIPNHMGLFLDETWRLHPRICDFTSELFYENKLSARDGRERQVLSGGEGFAFPGAGLFHVPVEHAGNQNSSLEEVEAIAVLVDELTAHGVTWIDVDGDDHQMTIQDILIVAPYNAQVGALKQRLPGCKIGTVDKFQGQQAAVVIYSMASSSPEDAPRGMGFLYNLNRLNVATSRARCACVLVCSPRLFDPECRSPEQMRWANALCRYREMAKTVLSGV